jgi:hypothetical protein
MLSRFVENAAVWCFWVLIAWHGSIAVFTHAMHSMACHKMAVVKQASDNSGQCRVTR